MAEHYNAFISYRHAPLDNRVAAEVQKRLERFRIPRATRKETGIRKIDRIFRDKEELLITSDLNDTIEQALSNSDYLIVICSRSTKESIWVQKEIAFFLKTHSRKQILTVLAEGEPGEVIPPILLTQEVPVTLDSGEEDIAIVPVEPLSCDYRGNFRTARKEELPRLAAAILGCSYDKLKQRQRQYRMRRLTLAFSAAALLLSLLAGYYAWSASQIRENYIQALRNESQYLAKEALSQLETGDRLAAIETALKALPADRQDLRPVLPEAEYALSQAVHAYVSPSNTAYSVEATFSHGGKIDDFFLSGDESRMVVRHSGNVVTLWDTQTRSRVFEKVLADKLFDACLLGNDRLLLLDFCSLSCYDCSSGTLLWKFSPADGFVKLHSLCLADQASRILFADNGNLLILDAADGSLLDKIPLPTYLQESSIFQDISTVSYQIQEMAVSPDGTTVAFLLQGDGEYIAFYDVSHDRFTITEQTFDMVDNLCFTPDNKLILTGDQTSRWNNYSLGDVCVYDNGIQDVFCMDPSGALLWTADFPYTQLCVGIPGSVAFLDFSGEDDTKIPAVACAKGESARIYDVTTGTLLREITFPSTVIGLSWWETHISAVLQDGTICSYLPDSQQLYGLTNCISGITMVSDKSALYVSDGVSGNILRYVSGLHDENWTPLEAATAPTFPSFHSSSGSRILLYDTYYKSGAIVDTQTLHYDTLSDAIPEDHRLLGFDHTGEKLLFQGYYDPQTYQHMISALDLTDGTYQNDWLPLSHYYTGKLFSGESGIFYESMLSQEDGSTQYAVVVQPYSGDSFVWPVTEMQAGIYMAGMMLSPDERFALLYTSQPRFYTVNLETGILSQTQDMAATTQYPIWSADSAMFFVNDENCIRAFDTGCREVYTIDCQARLPSSLFCTDDSLYVLYGTESICRYRITDGSLMGSASVNMGATVSSAVVWDYHDGQLALQNFDRFFLLDTATMCLKAQMDFDCVAFDLENRILLAKGTSGALGYFQLYDHIDLIEMAEKQLS